MQDLARILQVRKILRKILTKNSILARFLDAMAFLQDSSKILQDIVLYHKNFARNAFASSEDNLISWEQLTMFLNFRFTLLRFWRLEFFVLYQLY